MTHQAGLPRHAFASFLLRLSSAPESHWSPTTTGTHHAALPLGLILKKHCLYIRTCASVLPVD